MNITETVNYKILFRPEKGIRFFSPSQNLPLHLCHRPGCKTLLQDTIENKWLKSTVCQAINK